jgi:hypothetical protein
MDEGDSTRVVSLLGGNIVFVNVEVVDALLDYNLLLGRIWFFP